MRRGRSIVSAIGLVLALIGIYWMLQGIGIIRWPASEMVGDAAWVTVGSAVAVIGLFILLGARRFRW